MIAGPGGCAVGVAVGVAATGAVVVCVAGACDGLGELVGDVAGKTLGNLFSSGKSDKARLKSIESYITGIAYDVCRTDLHYYDVAARIQARASSIQSEYSHLGPLMKGVAESLFQDFWNDPCKYAPRNTPIIWPSFRDDNPGAGSSGNGKE